MKLRTGDPQSGLPQAKTMSTLGISFIMIDTHSMNPLKPYQIQPNLPIAKQSPLGAKYL